MCTLSQIRFPTLSNLFIPKYPSVSSESKSRTSSRFIPHSLAHKAYSYSCFPIFLSSKVAGNLIIQSSPSTFVKIFGRAPPDEPPFANKYAFFYFSISPITFTYSSFLSLIISKPSKISSSPNLWVISFSGFTAPCCNLLST